MELKKIKNKNVKASKTNKQKCYVVGKPNRYLGSDCSNDCSAYGKPPSWKSAYM
ncbi:MULTISPECIES: hypothetical protein [Peptostreptococcales]|uniref:hypothetical protein n=1 Tax=Peptostreptococcales TaxID=3082720 RepID=UPI001313DF2E|nr:MULTISPECIES: hypothetical protein [Peptostreptococcaceae]MEE0248396.1 hypothetical protein [Peptacetobacter hiranonis]